MLMGVMVWQPFALAGFQILLNFLMVVAANTVQIDEKKPPVLDKGTLGFLQQESYVETFPRNSGQKYKNNRKMWPGNPLDR